MVGVKPLQQACNPQTTDPQWVPVWLAPRTFCNTPKLKIQEKSLPPSSVLTIKVVHQIMSTIVYGGIALSEQVENFKVYS
jgi:hypothetical protein